MGFVALFTVAECQAYAERHDCERRRYQDYYSPGDSFLAVFGEGAGCAVTHGATLGYGGSGPEEEDHGE